MSTNEPPDPAQRQWLTTAGRILKSLAIAGLLYLLLCAGVSLYLAANRDNAAPATPEPPEPVYRDEYGNRMREVDYLDKDGYRRARAGDFDRHANCLALEKMMQGGCHRYVTQHNIPPHVPQGNFDSGKTTAECLREVDAYWQAIADDRREQQHDPAADVSTTNDWSLERQQCYAYDNSLAAQRRNVKPSDSSARD